MLKQILIVGAAALAIAGTTNAQTATSSGSTNATTGGIAATGTGGGTMGTDRTATSSTDPTTAQGVGNSPRSGPVDYGTTTAMASPQGPDGLTWQNGKWMKDGQPATKAQINAHKKWMADNGVSSPNTQR